MRVPPFISLAFTLVLGTVPQLAAAQLVQGHAGFVTVATAPRLHFTPAEMALAEAVAGDPDLAAFYGRNGLAPIFAGAEGAPRREALREAIAGAPRHGIPASRYALAATGRDLDDEVAHARALARLLKDLTGGVVTPSRADPEIKRQVARPPVADLIARFVAAPAPARVLAEAAPAHPAYRAMQAELLGDPALAVPAHLPRAAEHLWRVGMRGEDLPALRARLAAIGFEAEGGGDPQLYDAALSQAVMRYQQAAGLPADGIAGPQTIRRLNGEGPGGTDARRRALLIGMERLRWMAGEDLEARHVWVNIPEFSTTIVEGGREVFRTRSIMGKDTPEMRTPEFSDRMAHLVVNPSWNVPRSITVRDYLPQLQRNRHAVSHLDVVDRRGNVVARDGIDFSRFSASNFPYRMRQKPGDDNALGMVKFIFPNPWNIYLHDTPTRHLFANRVRAYSNGCIRIGDPVDLAHALLSRQTDDPAAMFRRARDSGRETWLNLRPAVPVHLVYFTAWPDETGRMRYFDDVYGRNGRVWAAMQREGIGLEQGN